MRNDYYEILGVTPDSDLNEIKSAYRRLARKFHPDVAPEYIDKFKKVNEAYSTLSDEKKRMQYNMLFGFYKKKVDNPKAENVDEKKENTEEKKAYKNKKVKAEEKTFFEDLFTNKTSQKAEKIDGSDLTAEVSITIAQAKSGCEKVINIVHTEICPKCKGRKFINGAYCTECQGSGEKTYKRKLTVKIPKGIKNGNKLRIKNEGNSGKNGGKNGDLYLLINIESNQNIRYEGSNVYYNIPLEPWEAVLGTTFTLSTLEGKISIKIPPKTKSGQKFRVQQVVNGHTTEILITVHIEIPSYLSDDEIKLYEKLKRISNANLRENFINE